MAGIPEPVVPTFINPAVAELVREGLRRQGFSAAGILDALGLDSHSSLSESDYGHLRWRIRQGRPIDVLVRLFLIGDELPDHEVAPALADDSQALFDCGLLTRHQAAVAATVRLLPWNELLLAFDLPRRTFLEKRSDYVMGLGASSITLANLTDRTGRGSVLDLGTGCGIQALLAARHSDSVVAVDRNPRAVAMTRFNAQLNGLANVDCRASDLFSAVAGTTFDLIVSNPPFVISPEARFIYRDSGLLGDEVTRRIAQSAPDYLTEGGLCQILCNWAHVRGQDVRERLASWFRGLPCDVWVLGFETRDAATYAATWIKHTEESASPERFDEWMEYYARQGIEAVTAGLVNVRKRTAGDNWVQFDEAPQSSPGPAEHAVRLQFDLIDWLRNAAADEPFMHARLTLAPSARLEQESVAVEGEWSVMGTWLQLSGGLAYRGAVDIFVASLLARCTGEQSFAAVVRETADSFNLDAESVTGPILRLARQLVGRGFLLPVDLARKYSP